MANQTITTFFAFFWGSDSRTLLRWEYHWYATIVVSSNMQAHNIGFSRKWSTFGWRVGVKKKSNHTPNHFKTQWKTWHLLHRKLQPTLREPGELCGDCLQGGSGFFSRPSAERCVKHQKNGQDLFAKPSKRILWGSQSWQAPAPSFQIFIIDHNFSSPRLIKL